MPAASRFSRCRPPSWTKRNGACERERRREHRVVGDDGVGGVAVCAVARRHVVEPVLRAVERGGRGPLRDVADADDVPLELVQAGLDERRLARDEAEAPGRHREALAEAPDQDHVRRAERGLECALVDAALVRLVGDHRQVVAGRRAPGGRRSSAAAAGSRSGCSGSSGRGRATAASPPARSPADPSATRRPHGSRRGRRRRRRARSGPGRSRTASARSPRRRARAARGRQG